MRSLLCSIALAGVMLANLGQAADLAFISIDALPWAGLDAAGRPVGVFADIVAELENRTGHRITISLQSFARVERELESGESDCAIILWNAARSRIAERGEAVYQMTFGVIARPGLTLASYEDLTPLSLSVVRHLRIDERFDADEKLRKDFDKDYATGLSKMERGRVDAIAGSLPTIIAHAVQEGLGHMLGERLVLSVIPVALQCSRRSPRIVHMPSLDMAIRGMRADGTLERLLARHGYH